MSHQRILSSRFNMSLGFIPVIISIILCEFITQDMSIYIGAGVGLLFSIYSVRHRGTHVPQIILYCTTGMLLLLSVTTLFLVNYCPRFMLPFTLEISAIIPPFVIYLNRRKFLDYHMSQTQKCCKQLFAQGAEAAIVSSRVILIISLLHFLIIFLAVLVSYPLGDTTRHILFYVAPPLVFISGILFNQFGIFYFNIVMNHTVFVPKEMSWGKPSPQKPSTGKTTISIRSSGLPLPHTACCFSSPAPNATFSRKIKSTC